MVTQNTTQEITPQTVPIVVPADYAALGGKTGYDPLAAKDTRHFIIGPEGKGKSTFLAGIPRTAIIDAEGGANAVPYSRAVRFHVQTAKHLHELVDKLVKDGDKPNRPFDRVGFDTVDQLLDVLNPELAKRHNKGVDITQYGSHGAGYSLLKVAFWNLVHAVQQAGYAWTVIGHLTEKAITVNKQERTVLRPVVFDSLSKQLARNCEVFANLYQETEEETLGKEWISVKGMDQKVEVDKRDAQGNTTRKVHRGYLDLSMGDSPIGTFQGKQRGVPTLRTKIALPHPLSGKYGWDAFVAEYDKAVAEVRTQIKGA
jgi:hypothetical protein